MFQLSFNIKYFVKQYLFTFGVYLRSEYKQLIIVHQKVVFHLKSIKQSYINVF